MSHRSLPLLLLCVAACSVGLADDKPLYTISKTIPIGAPDWWDLLTFDSESQRVYITHGDRVTVVDGRSGKLIGDIKGFAGGTHGVEILPGSARGYTDDGEAGTAHSFDTSTLKALKTIKAGDDADAIVFDPVSRHLFVINSDPGTITVIDTATDKVLATLVGGGKLEIGAADGNGKVYVNGEAKREVLRIDARTNTIDARWPIPSCESPHGIAVDVKARRVFSSCENNVMVVIDADSGKKVAELPIGSRTDGAAFDPGSKRAFSSNGDGTVTVIGEQTPDSFVVLGNVPTMRGARTMTLDPKSGRLYLMAADYTVNESVDPKDVRHRYSVVPGSAKLLFLDPADARK
jgi:YVTN family beta-propeller protein